MCSCCKSETTRVFQERGVHALCVTCHVLASSAQEWLSSGPLGQSGMLAAFSLIFLSEIGDKTFFIAALLAMKLGRWISFIGSVAALSVMTAISVGDRTRCFRVCEGALHTLYFFIHHSWCAQ